MEFGLYPLISGRESRLLNSVQGWRMLSSQPIELGLLVQDAVLRDLEGGEKSIKQLKARLKEILQLATGLPSRDSLRSLMSDGSGLGMRMSE